MSLGGMNTVDTLLSSRNVHFAENENISVPVTRHSSQRGVEIVTQQTFDELDSDSESVDASSGHNETSLLAIEEVDENDEMSMYF